MDDDNGPDEVHHLSDLLAAIPFFPPPATVHADDHGDDFASATSISNDGISNGILKNPSVLNFFKFMGSQSRTDLIYLRNTSVSEQVRLLKKILPRDTGGFS